MKIVAFDLGSSKTAVVEMDGQEQKVKYSWLGLFTRHSG